jgi:alkylhydroperoxidase family enzyme
VLGLVTSLTRTPAEVPDELFAALRAVFSERELVELSSAIAWENYRARFNRTFAIESGWTSLNSSLGFTFNVRDAGPG